MENSIEIDKLKLRKVAGTFATGVTVITVQNSEGEIHGMTANSFLSVSLNPPLVLFSIKNEAHLYKFLKIDVAIGISILSENQQEISNQFAGFNKIPIEVHFSDKANVKIIENSLAWYSTQIKEIIPTGDHHLVICQVIDLEKESEESPLLYFSGYKKIESAL